MKHIIIAILLLISIQAFTQTEVEIITNFEEAKQVSKEQNKPIFMLFTGSDWCPPCMYLENTVLEHETFQTYLEEQFVFLKLDYPRNKQQSRSQVEHNNFMLRKTDYNSRKVFPAIILVNNQGEKIAEIDYYGQPANELQETLNFVRELRTENTKPRTENSK